MSFPPGSRLRLVVRIMPKDSWYWPLAIIDPRTGKGSIIDAGERLDMYNGAWLPDGRVFGFANVMLSSLWRFQPDVAR